MTTTHSLRTSCKWQNRTEARLIITSDGGPDENPRYQNVAEVAIHHLFKRDLDGLFIATNAPGRSAYNRVERRMAPLSRDLCGLVLPHDYYGNHLTKAKSIDEELKKKNFRKSAETLAEILSESIINGCWGLGRYIG